MRKGLLTGLVIAALSTFAGAASAAPGDLDTSFDGDGKLTFAPGGKQAEIDDVAVQPDGKLVLAGWIDQDGTGGEVDFLVVRLNPDGSFDQSFGSGGTVTMNFPAKGTTADTAGGVAIQPDGKVVVAGTSHDNGLGVDRVAIARFNPNGTSDASFNPAGFPTDGPPPIGQQLIGINASANDVVLDPSGRILVAGGWDGGALFAGVDAYVLRLRSDGVADSSFNGGNLAFHFGFGDSSDQPEAVSRIAVQPDGKIALAGAGANSANQDAAMARVSPGAVLDPDFGAGGTQIFGRGDTNDLAQDLTLEPDGHILAAGAGFQGNSMMLVRASSRGPFENWSSGQTVVSVNFGKPSIANAIALQTNGKIVLGGSAGGDVAVARVQPGGAPDTSFGPDGKRTISFPDADADAFAMTLQGDGKIVLVGHDGKAAAVVRLQGDGAAGGAPGGPGVGPNVGGRVPRCGGRKATIVGTSKRDKLKGTRHADVIVGLGGNDSISGLGGNDVICGGDGNDTVSGGNGADKIYGEAGKDRLSGGAGNDTMSGGAGNDTMSGGAGNDTESGGAGKDKLAGGGGKDKLNGGSGDDKLNGGGGKDSCSGKDSQKSC
jgi:uncharacterized delta-60 repeat protein